MTSKKDSKNLSGPVIQRLSEYLLILEQLIQEEQLLVSSRALADAYGNTASQVRHDLFQLENTGSQSHGYCSRELASAIRDALDLHNIKKVCIVGMGNLGKAITRHVPFDKYGMKLSAAFDKDPELIGRTIGSLVVEDTSKMAEIIQSEHIDVATICVPAHRAQSICDILVKAGVKGILNYSRIRLKVPPHVTVHYEQIICSFMQLSYKTSL